MSRARDRAEHAGHTYEDQWSEDVMKAPGDGFCCGIQMESLCDGCPYVMQGKYPGVRELRLWHWNECMRYRKLENRWKKSEPMRAKSYQKLADAHLSAVQTLNQFFQVHTGDTAAADAATAPAKAPKARAAP